MSLQHELHQYIKKATMEDLVCQCIGCRKFRYKGEWLEYTGLLSKEIKKAITGGLCEDCLEEKLAWKIR